MTDRCNKCRGPIGDSPYYHLCQKCGEERSEYMFQWRRKRYGFNRWRPGGRGRPPFRRIAGHEEAR